MATIKTITIAITTRLRAFNKGMARVRKVIRNIGRDVGRMVRRFASIAAITTALGAGIGLLIRREQQLITQTTATADRLGITTERMSGLTFAAKQYEITQQNLELGLQRMTRRISEAAQGTGEAQNALKELNIDAERLIRLSPDNQFLAIADRLSQVRNQADRVRLGFKLFDSEGVDLIRLMQAGRKEITRMLSVADRVGLTFNRIDAARIEMANRAIGRMQALFQGVLRTLAIQLAPFVEAFANMLSNTGLRGRNMGETVINAFEAILKAAARAADFMSLLQGAWYTFQGITQSVALVVVGGLNAIGKGIENIINLVPGLDVKFTGFLDTLMDGFAQAALESKTSATAAIDAYTKGTNSRKVGEFFDGLRVKATQAAEAYASNFRTPDLSGVTGTLPGNQASRAAQFRQVNLDRIALGGSGRRREQNVRAPQLEETNSLLKDIRKNLSGANSAPTAVTA